MSTDELIDELIVLFKQGKLENDYMACSALIANLCNELTAVRDSMSDLEAEYDNIVISYESATEEIESLMEEVADAKESASSAWAAVREAEEKLDHTQTGIDHLHKEMDGYLATIEDQEEQIKQLMYTLEDE